MARNCVTAAFLDGPNHALEPLVGEGLDPPAVVADDVMVVFIGVANRLEARDAVAEIEPLDKPPFGELLEYPVHARKTDGLPAGLQLPMDLLRAEAALLAIEKVDHPAPGEAAAVARGPQLGQGPL